MNTFEVIIFKMQVHLMLHLFCLGFFAVLTDAEISCDFVVCENGGSCIIENDEPKCSCLPGYAGDYCETHICEPNPCKNNGTCVLRAANLCFCEDPYTGNYCDETVCDSNPCQNGGTCKVISKRDFSCDCPDEYTGDECEKYLCSDHHCENGGTCYVENRRASCVCENPFEGDKCEIGPCNPNPCTVGATEKCQINGTSFECKCIYGFEGRKCEIRLCDPNPCSNGGTCSMQGKEYSCTCRAEFTGKVCDLLKEQPTVSTTKTSTSKITAPTAESIKTTSPNNVVSTMTVTESSHSNDLLSTGTTRNNFSLTPPNLKSTTSAETSSYTNDQQNVTSSSPLYEETTAVSHSSIKRTFRTSVITMLNTSTTEAITDKSTKINIVTPFETTSKSSPIIEATTDPPSDVPSSTSEIFEITTETPTEIRRSTITTAFKSTTVTNIEDKNDTKQESSSAKNVTNYIVIVTASFAAVIAIAVSGWFIKRKCQKQSQLQYFRGHYIVDTSGNESLP